MKRMHAQQCGVLNKRVKMALKGVPYRYSYIVGSLPN